jgi:hypothetical protein
MLDGNRGVGKSNVFSDGEWSGEPDLLEFEAFGFKCQAKRHDNLGHLCGYIQVDANHPWHALTYDEVDVCVHGGLTFSEEGWFGFDCAHAGDLVPKIVHLANNYSGDVYRSMGYVVGELIKLAKQAKEASDES